jgi:hypothetical protein
MPAVRIAPASESFIEKIVWRLGIGVCDLRLLALPLSCPPFVALAK